MLINLYALAFQGGIRSSAYVNNKSITVQCTYIHMHAHILHYYIDTVWNTFKHGFHNIKANFLQIFLFSVVSPKYPYFHAKMFGFVQPCPSPPLPSYPCLHLKASWGSWLWHSCLMQKCWAVLNYFSVNHLIIHGNKNCENFFKYHFIDLIQRYYRVLLCNCQIIKGYYTAYKAL